MGELQQAQAPDEAFTLSDRDPSMWEWGGSRWWRFDFHTHSPASDDYGKGSEHAELRDITPHEWLLDFMRAGVDCVAVTDHNSGRWIDRLRSALAELASERPDGYRPLYLFPGIELRVSGGTHILVLLPDDASTADADQLLGAVRFTGTPGTCDSETAKSLMEVLDEVERLGGVAIPAHADGHNGLFSLTGVTLANALESTKLFAVEMVDTGAAKPQQYVDKRLAWTEVVGSDSHHRSSTGRRYPGSHFTWVKMGSPSIEGLRLALLDGSLSVRRSDQTDGDPNVHGALMIESIQVVDAKYIGRAEPFDIAFSPWLTALIGGRGTGKSTVVEFLRHVFRRNGELPTEAHAEFQKYGEVCANRDDAGLLTPTTRIVATYRKDGARFRLTWEPTGPSGSIKEHADGLWRPTEGDPAARFPVRFFSQKQIFNMATDPRALLATIDESADVNGRSWRDEWHREEAQYLSLRAQARQRAAELHEELRLRGELADIERRLDVFHSADYADVLKHFQRRRDQQSMLEAWEHEWVSLPTRLRALSQDVVPLPPSDSSLDPDDDADNDLDMRVRAVSDRLASVAKAVAQAASDVETIVSEWAESRTASVWGQARLDAEGAFERLRGTLDKENAGSPDAYAELVRQRQDSENRLAQLDEVKQEIARLNKAANGQISHLLDLRRQITERRKAFLIATLAGNAYVRIRVVPYGDRQGAEQELRKTLQHNEGFERDFDEVLNGIYGGASGGGDDALDAAKQRLLAIVSDEPGTHDVQDQRFVSHLKRLPAEMLDRLLCWFPEDSLDVEYSPTADGRQFRSLSTGSPGQKTAALLAFILSYGDEPLVLDQPEDDLDNHLIYGLIVRQIRDIKRRRQIVVVTHNPNIVVNGDAEFIVGLVARGGETRFECNGSLQEQAVRDTICEIMEGGSEALEQRYRRIHLTGT